jgi:hypothetical protein
MAQSSTPENATGTGDNSRADAFGSLAMPRSSGERTVLPPRDGEERPSAEPVVTKEDRLKRLIPQEHRESFSHSATWWQDNIEVFKHKETGRYLYLATDPDDETKVRAFQYTAARHKFVEVPMETALAFAAMGQKVAEKKRF